MLPLLGGLLFAEGNRTVAAVLRASDLGPKWKLADRFFGIRPVKHKIWPLYSGAVGKLRINARSVRERDLYRTHFGHHVFGDPHFFPGDEKYSLDPLLRRGEPSLVCTDVAGLEWVRLREVHVFWGGAEHAVEIHRADNVFRALDERGVRLLVIGTQNRTTSASKTDPPEGDG